MEVANHKWMLKILWLVIMADKEMKVDWISPKMLEPPKPFYLCWPIFWRFRNTMTPLLTRWVCFWSCMELDKGTYLVYKVKQERVWELPSTLTSRGILTHTQMECVMEWGGYREELFPSWASLKCLELYQQCLSVFTRCHRTHLGPEDGPQTHLAQRGLHKSLRLRSATELPRLSWTLLSLLPGARL